jgi:hypothetical protein
MRFLPALSASFLGVWFLAPTAMPQCGDPDIFEDNDTCETATYTMVGAVGLTVKTHDSDWFRLPVPPKGKIVVDVLFSHAQANVDARLWDMCDGTKIADGNTVDDDEHLVAVNLSEYPVDFFAEIFINPASSGTCANYDIVIEGASENLGENYCHTNTNSSGQAAAMSALGSLSVSQNHIVLFAEPVPPHEPGIFFYGPQRLEIPFANGWRCVGPGPLGTFVLPPVFSSHVGVLRTPLDLQTPPQPGGEILRGSTWNFQAWFRDPQSSGAHCNLSDGLTLSFLP